MVTGSFCWGLTSTTYNRPRTPERRQQHSEDVRNHWANPERRKSHEEANKQAWTPERRQRRSEDMRLMLAKATPAERKARVAGLERRRLEEAAIIRRAKAMPADWNDRPIEWRIIGAELLSQDDYMTNKELAARLDRSRIITCPYGKQTTWTAAVGGRAFTMAMNRLRFSYL